MTRDELSKIAESVASIAHSQLFEKLREIDSEMHQIRLVNRWNDQDFEIFEKLAYKRLEIITRINNSKRGNNEENR